jgi:TonB family protein
MMFTIIQSSIVLVVAFGAVQLLRRHSASVRHSILTIALLGSLIVPFAGPLFPARVASGNGVYARVQNQTEIFLNVTPALKPAPAATAHINVPATPKYPGYLAVWMSGTAVMSLFLIGGLARMIFLFRRSSEIVHHRWMDHRSQIAKQLGISRGVRLEQTERSILGTWGILRPRILLPRDAATWPEDRIRSVLTHELAHIKRLDWPIQILAELARAVYWFNPLFWILCRRLRIESEQACDDIVLNAGIDPADYAAHLLELARLLKNSGRAWSPVLAMAHPPSLERRFVAMLNPSLNRKPAGAKTIFVALSAALALTIPLAAMRAPVKSEAAPVVAKASPPALTEAKPAPAAAAKKPAAAKTAKPVAAPAPEAQGRADGALAGTVTDGTGAVIPGVTVTVYSMKQQGNSIVETPVGTAVANQVGKFEFPALPEGSYSLRATLPGFASATREWLQVAPSQRLEENITMSVGTISQQVVVTAVGTPRPKPAGTPQRIRVGGNVIAANLISQVKPIYPQSARDAGIEGMVRLQGIIGTDGTLIGLSAMNNVDRDLTAAALEAVRQWRYKPTLLNGEPVEVLTTIGVQFQLAQ